MSSGVCVFGGSVQGESVRGVYVRGVSIRRIYVRGYMSPIWFYVLNTYLSHVPKKGDPRVVVGFCVDAEKSIPLSLSQNQSPGGMKALQMGVVVIVDLHKQLPSPSSSSHRRGVRPFKCSLL